MSLHNARIAIVDDEPNIRRLLEGVLGDEGHTCVSAGSVEDLRSLLRDAPVDLLLLDVSLPGEDGMSWLREHLRSDNPDAGDVGAVIMMSGHGTIELALEAVRRGAADFLEKPIHGERLLLSVENALARLRLERENERLRAGATHAMVGDGPEMTELRHAIARASRTEAPVLIRGENGTGKELVARALHEGSSRRNASYVQLNCAAIPETLLESELFGHEAGAFSGAVKRRRGHFERADRGTLLLDEIGDMPLELQAKLLRVLEEGKVTRLGAESSRDVDVRVLAATHQDLAAAIQAGRFREDLYYRLAVLEVHVPALRERPGDVGDLARHFLAHYAREFSRSTPDIDDEAVEVLRAQPWPGNVRELRNVMARQVALSDAARVDAAAIRRLLAGPEASAAPRPRGEELPHLQEALDDTERDLIRRALAAHDGNKSAAARALGVDRANLHRKMKRLGLERP